MIRTRVVKCLENMIAIIRSHPTVNQAYPFPVWMSSKMQRTELRLLTSTPENRTFWAALSGRHTEAAGGRENIAAEHSQSRVDAAVLG